MKKRVVLCGVVGVLLWGGARAADCGNVGRHLNTLASADQQIRQEWNRLEQNPNASEPERDALQQRWRAVDAGNLEAFKEILAASGWPRTAKDSHSAWLLAQHADSDPAFQRHARGLLADAVKAGGGSASDLAYLSDRIATKERRPPEYGTQFSQTNRCDRTLDPVDDRKLVNQRRLAIGLSSLEEYEAKARSSLPADCTASAAGK